jgi:glucose-1-phosphate thymidylyltransferase
MGTPDSLLAASNLIQTLEKRQGLKVACLEEIAYQLGYITAKDVTLLTKAFANSPYGKYLLELVKSPPEDHPLYSFAKLKHMSAKEECCAH